MTGFPRIVIQFGLLSLFNDISSEMIFPLLPLFLTSLPGGGPVAIGIIEGVAETTGTFLKLASGIWSDRIKRRTPFVAFGYGLAGVARPLIALAASWPAVLLLRFIDRVGKGIRSAPRDAMIADSISENRRGAAFGFQRMMDHTGAVIGPLAAVMLMKGAGLSVRQVIVYAGIPTILLFAVLFTIKEPSARTVAKSHRLSHQRMDITGDFRLLLLGMFLFTLGNSTDAFLILALSHAGISTATIALLWSLHHVMKIGGAWLGGRFTDRAGSKPVLLTALCMYTVIYLIFGLYSSPSILIPAFILYGASIGLLEPAEGVWVAHLSSHGNRGAAYGVYHSAKGFAALPASVVFGILWSRSGILPAFGFGAFMALAGILAIFFTKNTREFTEASS